MFRVIPPISNAVDTVQQEAADLLRSVKPKLRGWLHLGMVPLTLVAVSVMIVLAPSGAPKVGAFVFGITGMLLFTTSAVYHRGTWGPRVGGVLKRMDHSNIFLIIAGSYTPFALTLLNRPQATSLLVIVWSGAIAGVIFRVVWVGAPRWLYTPIYVALGWVAIFYFGPLMRSGGVAIVTLIAVGGILYTLGAVVYGIKRPNPSPRWFGFHEVFHAFTVLAFAAHYVAASMAIYSTSPSL